MKKMFSITLIISVILISCFTEQPTKSEKLTSKQLNQAELANLIDKIASGEIDEKQTQHIMSKLNSGESYDKALKGLPLKSNKSQPKSEKLTSERLTQAEFDNLIDKIASGKIGESHDNEVFERLDRIEHNIKAIATFLNIEMDEKGRIIKVLTVSE